MTQQVKRAFRYRFYPTDEQAAELSRTFGCVRLVYNKALEERTRAWYGEQRRISYVQSSAALTEWKKTAELAFLSEVSSVPLQQALRHLQTAFGNFFAKRAKYPRYKSRKKSRASAEYTRSAFTWRDGRLTLAKMAEPLDIRWSRPLPEGAEPTTVTVSRDSAGRWFVAMLVEDTIAPAPATSAAVGLDAGITSLVTLSTGEKIANPRHERRDRARLAKAQRELSRKAKGSANREKARRKVARVHARITDRRRDFLHKLSARLVRENQTVVIEDLTVRNLLKNGKLARTISDAAWTDLRMMLEYKCAWYGRELVVIDRWFPSSKLCGACGTVREKLPLNVREWTCDCGTVHDRDVNAARNILAAGLAASACGDGVRPQRESSRTGRSSVKQETQRATAGIPRLQAGKEVNVRSSSSAHGSCAPSRSGPR
ncbi:MULTISPECIES: RNA-guided endonuclease TnpB family protein [Streptomyces]|uniref:RNA-guided endonuclease TnpB family protein n=2 Tax=Streptomyces TaxID=1883 RepID=A0ABD5J1H1_9ACTN|nr:MULTISPECIES: RNA-guided endonuclease TnpB family protein [Streptomyces]MEE4582208.1 RNA-guided endonuclease TnpB family protein [Streptomyces sp. DSM 41602]QTI89825.1 transposase [Streptomyces sp. AgN23]WTA85286.1 transposase [Streptomyces antimycoticus]